MKKICLLLLLVAGFADAQVITFTDPDFKTFLLGANAVNARIKDIDGNAIAIDNNLDGQIEISEALLAYSLNVDNNAIADVSGVENFTNLTDLQISSPITSLVIDALQNLKSVELTGMSSNVPLVNFSLGTLPNLENFRSYGMNLGVLDLSGSTILKYVFCASSKITSLTLNAANTLELLNCSSNQIPSLDVGGYTHLTQLNCNLNLLTSLNVIGCTALNDFRCNDNRLTSLDISGLNLISSFSMIGIDNMQLSNLNMSGCSSLISFSFNGLGLTSANFSGCSSLIDLEIGNSLMTNLDLTGCNALTLLKVDSNTMTSLDVSHLANLNSLRVYNNPNLSLLFMKNGSNEVTLDLHGDSGLQFVCVDDSQLVSVQNYLNTEGITAAVVNTYCSFTPGGNYNTISGMVRADLDNNGCTALDVIPNNVRINYTDGTIAGATFVNALGNYAVYTGIGDYTLNPALENDYFTINPASAAFNFPALDSSVRTQDFCMVANGIHPDLEIVLVPLIAARPGFDALYKIVFKNKGNQTLSGSVNLGFDDLRIDFVTASPAFSAEIGNVLIWDFINLQPFEVRDIQVTFNLNSPVENPALNAGDVLDFNMAIVHPLVDDTPQDNIFELHQTVVNSFDPNDKTCLDGTSVLPGQIGKYLHYNINFENTGTADAVNIVVRDIIDTTKFDIDSFQVMYASHPVDVRITGNKVEFIFENINLPPSIVNPIGGHGNVLFKIKTLPTLTVGDEVSNTANIYFDYNAPIDTNEARTAFNNLSKTDFVKDESVTVYPNPAKNKVTVKAAGTIKSVQLYDVQGRILQSVSDCKSQVILDIANQQRGVYFLRIITDKGSAVEKIIKD